MEQSLSPYALRICELLSEGLTSREVGVRVGSTPGAIDVWVSRIMKTVGVRNRSGLVVWYMRQYSPYLERNLTNTPKLLETA